MAIRAGLKHADELCFKPVMAEKSIGNVHEYTVSELSGAVKRSIEDNFGFVKVRGELGRVTRAGSGHVYLDLKDEKAVISSVMWKGVASRLRITPEQGMEVVATGRMSTFPGQSRYQLILDSLEPAGAGALMALFEERKKKLAGEGLFAQERKQALPYLPEVIGVVTSPSGAVIRDILHRLRERFPSRVIVWPTLVQGRGAENQIAAAIRGFNGLAPQGGVPRPDVLIVARGGGSLEDLWCFNEEVVVRAAAESDIPLISAVGHETDTTLIDYAADKRAPTPTAAAEFATPVRSELMGELSNKGRRFSSSVARLVEARRTALIAAMRGLGRPEDLVGSRAQALDRWSDRLRSALRERVGGSAMKFGETGARLRPAILQDRIVGENERIKSAVIRLRGANLVSMRERHRHLKTASARLTPATLNRQSSDNKNALARMGERLSTVAASHQERLHTGLQNAGRLLKTLSYQNVLSRGFVLVRREDGSLIRRKSDAEDGASARLQFADGEQSVVFGKTAKRSASGKPASKPRQANLFED